MRCCVALVLTVLLAGCTESSRGPTAAFDPYGDELFDAPWPTDARTDEDGTLDVRGFPNPDGIGMFQAYIDVADQQVGYAANGPIYVPFEGEIDTSALPDPEASLALGSPLALFDVDPASVHWGERFPVQWDFQHEPTAYQRANLLAVEPVWGFPLRPATTYALIVTTDVARANPDFAEVWEADHPDHALYADLQDALFFQGYGTDEVAVATVFTTTDPLDEMDRIVRFMANNIDPASLDQHVRLIDRKDRFWVYQGHYQGPLFQHGERPYATTGGGFRFREEDGAPIIYDWDDMRMAITTPVNLGPTPEGGWPVVIYQHGTGGSYRSFCNGNDALEVAAQLAEAGIIGIGIDQPLHGTRKTPDTEEDIHSFNYFNPESARANFRQGAIDAIYLAQSLAAGPTTFKLPGDRELVLDPDRIFFMGHSQGGLTGALALPWLGEYVDAAVLSGAGGGLSITVVERKDPTDIALMLADLLHFHPDEHVTEFHPVVALIQTLVEVTDPIDYAPYWYSEQGALQGQHPTSVLMFSGYQDDYTPFRTAEALATAARAPFLAPSVTSPESQTLRGLAPESGPLQGNVPSYDGTVTAALSQWSEHGHYVIFDDADAAAIYRTFLETASEGTPVIEPVE